MRVPVGWRILVALAALSGSGRAGELEVSFAERTLTVRTRRYEIRWRDGSMVALKSFLPEAREWTQASGAMGAEALPSGLGSLHGQVAAGRAQHHPWSFSKPGGAFAAQHPPAKAGAVRFEPIPRGARLTCMGLRGEPGGVLVQELTVEEGTGDLVIRQRGRSPHPGVFGIGFSLLNLRPDLELAVPYFGGQRWGRDFTAERLIGIAWPQFWSAGLVVGQAPQGGTFAVWAEDAEMRPKTFRCLHTGEAMGLGFQSNAEAPYAERTEAAACTWRFNTFAGSWQEPAARYKRWMAEAWKLVPRAKRTPKWASELSLIWPHAPSEAEMKAMAQLIEPRKVLIQHWGWLRGFNRRVPEYVPQDTQFAAKIGAERRLGYHSCAYTSMALLDQEAFPKMMASHGLEYQYHAPWQPKAKKTSWLVYVHPGSESWRSFYVERMAEVARKYGLDTFYQDVSGCGTGSSGLIEGRNFHQAVVACEEAIRERLPQVALAGEFWNEVNVCREDFGLQNFLTWDSGAKWDGARHADVLSRPGQPHPILSYLFSDFCVYWPHRVPIRDTELFHRDQNIGEVVGAIPVWTTTVGDLTGEARVMLERARLWAAGFRPWFPERWEAGAVAWLRNPEGRTVCYRRQGASTWCEETADGAARLVYGRIHGERAVAADGPCHIDGWLAYGENGPIGLDPKRWHCVFPGRPPELPVVLTGLPEGGWVAGSRLTADYWLIELGGSGEGTVGWKASRPFRWVAAGGKQHGAATRELQVKLPCALLFGIGEARELRPPAGLALDEWHHAIVSSGTVVKPGALRRKGTFTFDGVSRTGYHVHPPLGGKGSELSIDALVAMPRSPTAALEASIGIIGSSGDGVHLVVRVNGREVWRRFRETKPGWRGLRVPLGEFAGQTVVLSLAVDCGPGGFNLSCDEVVWGEPRIVTDERN